MIEPEEIEKRLRASLPEVAHLRIADLTGGKDHYQATIVTPHFATMNRVEQHQAVYRALGELMHGPIHALALRTLTPEAWAKLSDDEKNA